MALNRVLPGLNSNTSVTKKHKFYTDVDLFFLPKKGAIDSDGVRRGDVFTKVDVAAVTQSITTILLTNKYEKPFLPDFGADLRSFLFDPMEDYSESVISNMIIASIVKYEPRVKVKDVIITDLGADKRVPKGASTVGYWGNRSEDRFSLMITVVVQILSTNETVNIDVNMNRLR